MYELKSAKSQFEGGWVKIMNRDLQNSHFVEKNWVGRGGGRGIKVAQNVLKHILVLEFLNSNKTSFKVDNFGSYF